MRMWQWAVRERKKMNIIFGEGKAYWGQGSFRDKDVMRCAERAIGWWSESGQRSKDVVDFMKECHNLGKQVCLMSQTLAHVCMGMGCIWI